MTLTLCKQSLICGASGLLVAVLLQASWAQEDAYRVQSGGRTIVKEAGRTRDTQNPYGLPTKQPALNDPNDWWAGSSTNQPHRAPDLGPEFGAAVEALRAAEDDKAKSMAEDHLRDLLTEYFGKDMKRREAELKEMEKRLKKLQEQLALRSEKMDEIVDLQMKVLVNQANGLGFFSNGPSSESQPTQNSYWYYSPRPTIAAQPPTAPVIPSVPAAPATSATNAAPPEELFGAPPEEPAPERSR